MSKTIPQETKEAVNNVIYPNFKATPVLNDGTYTIKENETFIKDNLPEGLTIDHINKVGKFLDETHSSVVKVCYDDAKNNNFNFTEPVQVQEIPVGDYFTVGGAKIHPNGELHSEIRQCKMDFTAIVDNAAQQTYAAMNK